MLGFTLHNVTEGIGIAAPLVRSRPPLSAFVGLALLAGAPAIIGMWLGSLAYSPQWSALALAVGAGAILQVIVEVGAYLVRSDARWKTSSVPVSVIGGLVAGSGADVRHRRAGEGLAARSSLMSARGTKHSGHETSGSRTGDAGRTQGLRAHAGSQQRRRRTASRPSVGRRGCG